MGSAETYREVEIKLRVSSGGRGRRILREAGFRVLKRRTLECDTVYDTPENALRNGSKLLRIRSRGPQTLLTYKGPPRPGVHKVREEIELSVSDGHALGLVLERLKMSPTFRYEKYRTHFSRPGESGEAMLDETPIGAFIELEGPPEWIDSAARNLGYTQADYITASYARLYFESRGGRPETSAQMIFGDQGE